MMRVFNTTGSCNPEFHYMVNIEKKLAQIKLLIDRGAYFTMNRARQYGKTTTIEALRMYLEDDYVVLSLDFQALGNAEFRNEIIFSKAFVRYLTDVIRDEEVPVYGFDHDALDEMISDAENKEEFTLNVLFSHLAKMCRTAAKPIVMIIDEVDSATNNQVFLDFLAQLRLAYLNRTRKKTFQSVIFAGVHDVKNIKCKIRSEEEHKVNSPWNIAEEFLVNMSFSADEIKGMLKEYEMYDAGLDEKPQYIENGCLNMKDVLTRFIEIFDDIYGDQGEKFFEDIGRKYFMLFMKPIINGVGFSYIEARTRNSRRTDMIVQYNTQRFIIEMKIWKGPKYHEEGEQQLTEYLDSYHLDTGYMLTFNFNKKKERGIREKTVNGKTLIEAVV